MSPEAVSWNATERQGLALYEALWWKESKEKKKYMKGEKTESGALITHSPPAPPTPSSLSVCLRRCFSHYNPLSVALITSSWVSTF